jgi:hypothetical protein
MLQYRMRRLADGRRTNEKYGTFDNASQYIFQQIINLDIVELTEKRNVVA